MGTDPTQPASTFPDPVSAEPTSRDSAGIAFAPPAAPPARRPHVNLSAVFGALSCALVIVAFFLPWIEVPAAQRARIRAAFTPRIDEIEDQDPSLAQQYRILLDEAVTEGRLTGLDLFLYARSARDLNRAQSGATSDDGAGRPALFRRAFLVAYVTLAVLPVLGLFLAVHFLIHKFRRAKSPVLILLVLLGCAGGAIAVAWDQASGAFDVTTGLGLRLMLGAAVAQVCAGLFGVTAKNWWRVYAGAIVTLAAVSTLVWLYVGQGVSFPWQGTSG